MVLFDNDDANDVISPCYRAQKKHIGTWHTSSKFHSVNAPSSKPPAPIYIPSIQVKKAKKVLGLNRA